MTTDHRSAALNSQDDGSRSLSTRALHYRGFQLRVHCVLHPKAVDLLKQLDWKCPTCKNAGTLSALQSTQIANCPKQLVHSPGSRNTGAVPVEIIPQVPIGTASAWGGGPTGEMQWGGRV